MFQVDTTLRCTLDQLLQDPWMVNGPTTINVKTIECKVLSSDLPSEPEDIGCVELKRKGAPPQ
jgi:hypothetical protein